MLTDGPIPRFLHGIIEYVAALALLLAPAVLGFDELAATVTAIAAGLVVLALAAMTDGPTSLINQLPITMHVVLDYVIAVALIASPLLFGFSGDTTATTFFVALGAVHLLVTIGTRFRSHEHGRGHGRAR